MRVTESTLDSGQIKALNIAKTAPNKALEPIAYAPAQLFVGHLMGHMSADAIEDFFIVCDTEAVRGLLATKSYTGSRRSLRTLRVNCGTRIADSLITPPKKRSCRMDIAKELLTVAKTQEKVIALMQQSQTPNEVRDALNPRR